MSENVDVNELKERLTKLETLVGQLFGMIDGLQKMIQAQQSAPQPQPQQQQGPNVEVLSQLLPAFAPIIQTLFGGGSDNLTKMLLEVMINNTLEMNKSITSFISALTEALATSLGKKAGERLGERVIAVTEE